MRDIEPEDMHVFYHGFKAGADWLSHYNELGVDEYVGVMRYSDDNMFKIKDEDRIRDMKNEFNRALNKAWEEYYG